MHQYKQKPANQDQITLYHLVGEAVCMVQILEEAICYSITLKKDVKEPYCLPFKKAEESLKKYDSRPLGIAIKIAREASIFAEKLQQTLDEFLLERNWLVHKCVKNMDEAYFLLNRDNLLQRIKTISQKANILQNSISKDLMEYSSSVGLDMSNVRTAIRKHYKEN